MSGTQAILEPMWKPKEVAAFLKKSVVWVQREAAKGRLPHRKIGKDLRFYAHEIEAWANGQSGDH